MKRGLTKTVDAPKEEICSDDDIASHPLPKRSPLIPNSGEYDLTCRFTNTTTVPKEEINADHNIASHPPPKKSPMIPSSGEYGLKRRFTKTTVVAKEEICADDDIASHLPPKSQKIRGSGEYGQKRGYIRIVVLPEEGIHADDGFLFHHVASHPRLSFEMIYRLREHGIPYKFNILFKAEEDEAIRHNWKQFAGEYNIPFDQALKFAGVGDNAKNCIPQEVNDRRYFCENTNFWPRMCNGLEGRSGYQIKKRMIAIYEDAATNGGTAIRYGKCNKLSQFSHLINYVEAYPKCKYIQYETAKAIGITRAALKSFLPSFLKRQGNTERIHWKCLRNTVDRLVEVFPRTKTFQQKYKKAIMCRDRSELTELTKSIKFSKIANIMLKNTKSCKKAWNELTEELLQEYDRSCDGLKTRKEAFKEACGKVFSERAFISPDRFSLFLRLLPQCLKDDAISKTTMKRKYFHMDRLAEMLLDYGISGFHVSDPSMSEVECIYSHAKTHLTECDTEVFTGLNRILTLKEKIQIFTKAYDMQFLHICSRKNIFPIEGENNRKNYVITKDGFLCFKMVNCVKALTRYLASENPSISDSDSSDEEDITD